MSGGAGGAAPLQPEPAPLVLTVRRAFEAPAEQVFDAWLDAAAVGRWLFATPDGVMERVELDARVGGSFLLVERRGEELAEHFGSYLDIQRPRRLVFTFGTDRAEPPSRVTVEITPAGEGCELVLTHAVDAKWAPWAERVGAGWSGILDELDSTLAADREIVLTRLLVAPRERVWSAWTEREHVDRWWGPDGFSNATSEMEVRPGGVWRYTMRGPDGTVYPNRVRYRVVERPERLEYDHDDDGAGEHAFRVTVTFREEGERTRVTMRMRLADAAAREAAVAFGAVELGQQTLGRLAAYVGAA